MKYERLLLSPRHSAATSSSFFPLSLASSAPRLLRLHVYIVRDACMALKMDCCFRLFLFYAAQWPVCAEVFKSWLFVKVRRERERGKFSRIFVLVMFVALILMRPVQFDLRKCGSCRMVNTNPFRVLVKYNRLFTPFGAAFY